MSRDASPYANADQALIHRFLAQDGRPLAVDSNPLAHAMQAVLHAVDCGSGTVQLDFAPDPLFVQGTGVLQGGAVSAMLDFAMAFATLAKVPVGVSCATANINVSYLLPAPVGRYRAIGRIERCGRSVAFTQAQLKRCDTDALVATATSTLMLGAVSASANAR